MSLRNPFGVVKECRLGRVPGSRERFVKGHRSVSIEACLLRKCDTFGSREEYSKATSSSFRKGRLILE